MRRPLNVVGSSQHGRFERFNGSRTINWQPYVEGDGAAARLTFHPDPGLRVYDAIGEGPHRSNMVCWRGRLYGVSGRSLFSITGTGTATVHGTLGASSGRVSIAAGRNMLCIVDGTAGYTYNGSTLALITDGDFFFSSRTVTYLDGYFIVHTGDQYQISALEDATSWAALDFASAEGASDDIAAVTTNNQDLYLVGATSTEVHTNTGAADFPFAPYGNSAIGYGTPAPHSVDWGVPGLFMLAETTKGGRCVVMLSGLDAKIVSDPDIDWQIEQLGMVSDAVGWLYQQAGTWFYQLTFPTDRRTFVYCVSTGLWHERRSYLKGRHRANSHGYINGKHYVGDFESGNLYQLDYNTLTDNGDVIERIRITPPFYENEHVVTFSEVVLSMNTGVGLAGGAAIVEGDGADPQVWLRYSDDGQRTWSAWATAPFGKIGEYRKRVVFSGLGDSIRRHFEIRVTAPVPAALQGAYAEVTVATN